MRGMRLERMGLDAFGLPPEPHSTTFFLSLSRSTPLLARARSLSLLSLSPPPPPLTPSLSEPDGRLLINSLSKLFPATCYCQHTNNNPLLASNTFLCPARSSTQSSQPSRVSTLPRVRRGPGLPSPVFTRLLPLQPEHPPPHMPG
jgi:hypothetical protein